MCGRYTATQVNPAMIADRFGVREEAGRPLVDSLVHDDRFLVLTKSGGFSRLPIRSGKQFSWCA